VQGNQNAGPTPEEIQQQILAESSSAPVASTDKAEKDPALFKKILGSLSILDILLVFIPVAIFAAQRNMPVLTFFASCLGIIPLAGWMGKATEHLADKVGDALGGLLNATFGNACEFIIALAAIRAGPNYYDLVKASITGSIIGNVLLVLGASMIAGGMKYPVQTFNRTSAMTSATLLALAAVSLIVPAIFHFSSKATHNEDDLALGISLVLFSVYILSLIFSLKTHKHLHTRPNEGHSDVVDDALGTKGWSIPHSICVLLTATVLVAILSELLVHAVDECAHSLGMNKIFIGVILVAIIGNAAEHSTAIFMAMKDKMDLAINIALGSGAQIALLVAPVLVFLSFLYNPGHGMDLRFTEFEVLSVVASVIVLQYVASDGECNWLEGVQLLAVYAILGTAFFYM
jgi:Ca2+:H+ antiporter